MRNAGHGKRLHIDLGRSLTGDAVWVGGKMLNTSTERRREQVVYHGSYTWRVPGAAGYCWE